MSYSPPRGPSIDVKINFQNNPDPISGLGVARRMIDEIKSWSVRSYRFNPDSLYTTNDQSAARYQLNGVYRGIANKVYDVRQVVLDLKDDSSRQIEELKLSNEDLRREVQGVRELLQMLLENGQRAYPSQAKTVYPIIVRDKSGEYVGGFAEYVPVGRSNVIPVDFSRKRDERKAA